MDERVMNQQQDYYNALLSQQQGLSQIAQMQRQQQMQGYAYGACGGVLGGLLGGLGGAYGPEGLRNSHQQSSTPVTEPEPETAKESSWRFDTPTRRDAFGFAILLSLIVAGIWML